MELKDIEKDSLLTDYDISDIMDYLFEIGVKIPTKANSLVSGEEIDAFYYDCTREDELKNEKKVLHGSGLTKDEFHLELCRWKMLNRDIKYSTHIVVEPVKDMRSLPVFRHKQKGEYLSLDNHKIVQMQKERDEAWDKIKYILKPEPEPKEIRNSQIYKVKGFDSGLSDKQLEILCNELKDYKFLDKETDSKHFINAFNGKDLEEGFKPLKWIDETQRNHYISIQTVFQLLDSCNISLKGENNIIPQVRETIKQVFENDFGNIQSKFNDFNALKTPRHILIDSKVKDLT